MKVFFEPEILIELFDVENVIMGSVEVEWDPVWGDDWDALN